MRNLILVFLLLSATFCISQEKETVYLLFDHQSKETCKINLEGKGYATVSKYRKTHEKDLVSFQICDETFGCNKKKQIDTLTVKDLDKVKIVDFEYLIEKHSLTGDFKHHVFRKIYFIEKVTENTILKYDVTWADEIISIDN